MEDRLTAEQAADWAGRHLGLDSDTTYTFEEAAASLAKAAGMRVVPATEPGQPGMIHGKIIEVMRAVGPVAKAGRYDEGATKYNYRKADDVFDALHPAMAAAGIYPKPIVREVIRVKGMTANNKPRTEITLKITYRFTAEDGSYEDVYLEVDNWNTSDKGIGAAMTVALRIALLQLFVIATGDPDPDSIREETASTAPYLSAPLAQHILRTAKEAPLERLEEAWRLLTAHVPGDQRVPGIDVPTVWWEVFADRYRAEVDARRSKDDLAELWKRLKGFGLGFLVGGGVTVADLISQRGTALSNENKQALQECRDVIADADDEPGLDHAREVIRTHLTNHRINSADSLLLLEQVTARSEAIRDAESTAAREAMDDGDGYDDTRDQADRLP